MPSTDSPLVHARRERLRSWIQEKFNGSRKAFIDDAANRGHKIDPTEISNLQNGHKSFGEKKALALEEQAGMPDGYLVRPSPAAGARGKSAGSDWTDILGYSQAVGLGAGSEAQEYAETHKLKFRADSLARKHLRPDGLAVMYGAGDSMLPRIRPGDAVLFDTKDTTPKDGAIFVVLWKGEIYAKRAMVLDDAVYFACDNPAGDHQWRKPKRMDAKRDPVHILGRVRWIGSWED